MLSNQRTSLYYENMDYSYKGESLRSNHRLTHARQMRPKRRGSYSLIRGPRYARRQHGREQEHCRTGVYVEAPGQGLTRKRTCTTTRCVDDKKINVDRARQHYRHRNNQLKSYSLDSRVVYVLVIIHIASLAKPQPHTKSKEGLDNILVFGVAFRGGNARVRINLVSPR